MPSVGPWPQQPSEQNEAPPYAPFAKETPPAISARAGRAPAAAHAALGDASPSRPAASPRPRPSGKQRPRRASPSPAGAPRVSESQPRVSESQPRVSVPCSERAERRPRRSSSARPPARLSTRSSPAPRAASPPPGRWSTDKSRLQVFSYVASLPPADGRPLLETHKRVERSTRASSPNPGDSRRWRYDSHAPPVFHYETTLGPTPRPTSQFRAASESPPRGRGGASPGRPRWSYGNRPSGDREPGVFSYVALLARGRQEPTPAAAFQQALKRKEHGWHYDNRPSGAQKACSGLFNYVPSLGADATSSRGVSSATHGTSARSSPRPSPARPSPRATPPAHSQRAQPQHRAASPAARPGAAPSGADRKSGGRRSARKPPT
eukprot:TRINITY_DN12876_c0_g1_i1.p1 TRINITY_DN12876_c0_g1~~TRINITY_DN12876_c0_g1_i1.p1  ORF type:complete len:379 (+),score=49.96 TRINITY_DN12876_c0_g1_i1:88-1224(+)